MNETASPVCREEAAALQEPLLANGTNGAVDEEAPLLQVGPVAPQPTCHSAWKGESWTLTGTCGLLGHQCQPWRLSPRFPPHAVTLTGTCTQIYGALALAVAAEPRAPRLCGNACWHMHVDLWGISVSHGG